MTGAGRLPPAGRAAAVMVRVRARAAPVASWVSVGAPGHPVAAAARLAVPSGSTASLTWRVPLGPDGRVSLDVGPAGVDVVLVVTGYLPATPGRG